MISIIEQIGGIEVERNYQLKMYHQMHWVLEVETLTMN